MSNLLLFALGGVLVIGVLAAIKSLLRSPGRLVGFKLTFPRGLEADSVASAMAGISGLLLPWWRRWVNSPFISLETHADSSGIRHYLVVPEQWADSATNVLQASVPSVRFVPTDLPVPAVRTSAEYRMTSHQRPLSVEAADLSRRLLVNLQPLEDRESIVVQWVVTPHGPVQPAKVGNKNSGVSPFTSSLAADGEAVTALRKKQSSALLLACGRIGIRARTGWREQKLLRVVEASWHETRSPGVHLRRRLLPSSWVSRSIARRKASSSEWPMTLNSEELAGLAGWPIEQVAVPGLVLGGCRLLPPSPSIPSRGVVVADSNYPGVLGRPIALDYDAATRPTLVLGPTGTGKSTMLANCILADIEMGRGVIVLDPKTDLIDAVLERIPKDREEDVIVLDPRDPACPGLNPLRSAGGADNEVVVSNLVGTFKALYKTSWGPRLEDLLLGALTSLTSVGGYTLCEVPLILSDPNFRRRIIGQLDDPVGVEAFWGWFESISDAERQNIIGPVNNKLRTIVMRPRLRTIFGQSQPRLDIGEVMSKGKILLCSVSEGALGEEASALFGAMLTAEIWHATTARDGIPVDKRRLVRAYFDEFHKMIALPTPMGTVLAMARGLGLGVTLATQHLQPLGEDVRAAVLANCRTKVAFQLTAADARIMEREVGRVLTADDFQGLGAYEVACQMFAEGLTQAPATGSTRPLPDTTSDGAELRAVSRQLYGTNRDEVERSIRIRQSGAKADPVIGRRARPGGRDA